jgi:hypothetical protein
MGYYEIDKKTLARQGEGVDEKTLVVGATIIDQRKRHGLESPYAWIDFDTNPLDFELKEYYPVNCSIFVDNEWIYGGREIIDRLLGRDASERGTSYEYHNAEITDSIREISEDEARLKYPEAFGDN